MSTLAKYTSRLAAFGGVLLGLPMVLDLVGESSSASSFLSYLVVYSAWIQSVRELHRTAPYPESSWMVLERPELSP